MKNNLIVLLSFLFVSNTFSQTVFTTAKSDIKPKSKSTYFQFDISLALKGNPNAGETNEYSQKKESWFLPDGLGSKIGYGLHFNKWVALGIHTGINWEWGNKLVVAPIFANFKLSPKIGDQTRIVLQTGIGKTIALGRGNLLGNYKKISLGLQADDVLIFIEISHYDFLFNNQKNNGNISLGISLITF